MVEWNKNTPVNRVHDKMTPEEAAVAFASQYDPAIKGLLHTLRMVDYDDDTFTGDLDYLNDLMSHIGLDIPAHLTIGESEPYVHLSDLMTLGLLAFRAYQAQDQIIRVARERGEM